MNNMVHVKLETHIWYAIVMIITIQQSDYGLNGIL